MKRIASAGIAIAKAFYGKSMSRFPFLIGFWEFFCSKIARFDRMKVTARGMSLWIDPADMGCGIGLLVHGERFEGPMVRLFRGLLAPGMNVIDVGANIGFFSILASRLVGEKGSVISFEPNPYNYGFLAANIEENAARNVTPVQKAVSNERGTIDLFLYPGKRSGSARGRIFNAEKGWEGIPVEVTTVDAYLEGKGTAVELVKMDVEGVEEKVILGMRRTIAGNPRLKITMEFVPHLLKLAGTDPVKFLDALAAQGFAMYEVGEEDIAAISGSRQAIALCEKTGGLNILCTRQPLPEKLKGTER